MSALYTGGCACGAIRYEAAAEPLFAGHCHCRDCQRITGAQMATVAAVPGDAFTVQGTPKVYATTGQSGGKVHRSFCGNCGSTLFSQADSLPGMYLIEAGSLDDASGLKPEMHIFTATAQPWASIPADAPQFPGMPPAG